MMTRGNDFNCPDCDERLQQERGCFNNGIIPTYYFEKILYRCPFKVITKMSWEYLRAYNLYQKSILPNGKGWLEESDKLINALMVIENEMALLNEALMKKKS